MPGAAPGTIPVAGAIGDAPVRLDTLTAEGRSRPAPCTVIDTHIMDACSTVAYKSSVAMLPYPEYNGPASLLVRRDFGTHRRPVRVLAPGCDRRGDG